MLLYRPQLTCISLISIPLMSIHHYYPTLEILSLFIAGHIPVQDILLGDSDYALKSYLLTPYLNPIEPYKDLTLPTAEREC